MNILIVEDERIAARRLERLTREILGAQAGQVTCLERLEESEQFLERHDIDVLLLDLNLNGRDGFGLLDRVTAAPFQTIVVSANTDEALRAFEHGVLDFVPKPFERERLAQALGRLSGAPAEAGERGGGVKYLSVKRSGALHLVPIEEVIYLQGAGDYVEIHLRDGTTELHSKSLESLERILPQHFSRVHKSYVVDMRLVKEILVHGGGKYELQLAAGQKIPLSRTRYRDLSSALQSR